MPTTIIGQEPVAKLLHATKVANYSKCLPYIESKGHMQKLEKKHGLSFDGYLLIGTGLGIL